MTTAVPLDMLAGRMAIRRAEGSDRSDTLASLSADRFPAATTAGCPPAGPSESLSRWRLACQLLFGPGQRCLSLGGTGLPGFCLLRRPAGAACSCQAFALCLLPIIHLPLQIPVFVQDGIMCPGKLFVYDPT